MDEQGKQIPKNAADFVAEETGGELSNPDEKTDQSAEFQLTPEMEEKIMQKVMDINEPDWGYHTIGTIQSDYNQKNDQDKLLSSVLSNGIFAKKTKNEYLQELLKYKRTRKWDWLDRDSEIGQFNEIFYNVTGIKDESPPLFKGDTDISEDPWVQEDKPLVYGIIFSYQENRLEDDSYSQSYAYGKRDNLICGARRTFERIAPQTFQGVFIKINRNFNEKEKEDSIPLLVSEFKKTSNKMKEEGYLEERFNIDEGLAKEQLIKRQYIEDLDPKKLKNKAKEIGQTMLRMFEGTPRERFILPVYDVHGNLLWPRQMSYEEVKQFVADRDFKKQQSESNESQEEPPIQPEELDETS